MPSINLGTNKSKDFGGCWTGDVKNPTATVEHEASTSKIGKDQIFYCNQHGISNEDAINMIVSGFCKEVFRDLPMEFRSRGPETVGC